MGTGIITKWKTAVAELGFINTLLYGLDRLLSPLGDRSGLYKYYLVAQPVPDAPQLPAHRGKNIEVRQIQQHDAVLEHMPRPKAVIESHFRQGAICLGAFKDDELQGYAWIKLGTYEEDEVRCHFVPMPEGVSAWDFDVYLYPKHRIGFAFARLWDEVNAWLRGHNSEWTMSRISAFNKGSLASHQALGACHRGSATFMVIGSWQLMLATVSPFIHFSVTAKSAPTIRVHPPVKQD